MSKRSRTKIVDNGDHRVIVSEHGEQMYLAVGNVRGDQATLLNPRLALEIASALIEGAGRNLERQFQRQMGSV
jgi:hypothetical protein